MLADFEIGKVSIPFGLRQRERERECTKKSRLQEKVIDIEVANHTPSPTIEPSVRTILVGHSMGGIVAADTLLSLTSDKAIETLGSSEPTSNTLMFPYIQGVLAFDTPYLGISPGVVAYSAEEHYNTATSTITQLAGMLGWGEAKNAEVNQNAESKRAPVAALPAPPPTEASVPAWQRWGKFAMYAGAAGAVAAGGAAAYLKREQITGSWSWVGSHLEFVGCLLKGEELKKRLSGVVKLEKGMSIGFANIYTRLGKKAQNRQGSTVGSVIGNQRTFCNLPKRDAVAYFYEAINDAASDEVWAHMGKFDIVRRIKGSKHTDARTSHVHTQG